MDLIDKHIINRSTIAIKVLPLTSFFYKDIQKCGLSAEEVFEMKEKYISNLIFIITSPPRGRRPRRLLPT